MHFSNQLLKEYCSFSGILKKNVAVFSSEIIRKQKEVFTDESSKYTFVLRTKDVKFDCEILGKSEQCIFVWL